MRGKYNLRPWEEAKWTKEFNTIVGKLERGEIDKQALTDLDLCPANVITILELNGWTKYDFETGGWEQDTWYYFSHPNYSFELTLFYCGYLFEMDLYRKEDEE